MLRAVEADRDGRRNAVQGKMAIAELAEAATDRICRVLGGGTFSRSSPFGHWYEDVRALGFLRPPGGLAYDNLFTSSLAALT
jgi:alkylation response protein AidB-like acyl-CoA dehydrogenase